jgi:hypothetical protein
MCYSFLSILLLIKKYPNCLKYNALDETKQMKHHSFFKRANIYHMEFDANKLLKNDCSHFSGFKVSRGRGDEWI